MAIDRIVCFLKKEIIYLNICLKMLNFFCFGSKIGELMSTTNTGFIVSFFPVKYNKNKIHYSKKSVFYTIKIAKNSLVFGDEKFDYKIVLGEKMQNNENYKIIFIFKIFIFYGNIFLDISTWYVNGYYFYFFAFWKSSPVGFIKIS